MPSVQGPPVAPRQFRVVSRVFGYPIYVAAIPEAVSDRNDEAVVYNDRDDNGELKARYFSTVMGYPFNVEYVQ